MGEHKHNGLTTSELHSSPKIVEVAPALTDGRLEEVERMTIENFYLKIQNIVLQMKELDRAKEEGSRNIVALQKELEQYRAKLAEKYGRPIERTSVNADGSFINLEKKA